MWRNSSAGLVPVVILLHYYSGCSLKEIATAIGISYANTKLLHGKALTHLRQHLMLLKWALWLGNHRATGLFFRSIVEIHFSAASGYSVPRETPIGHCYSQASPCRFSNRYIPEHRPPQWEERWPIRMPSANVLRF